MYPLTWSVLIRAMSWQDKPTLFVGRKVVQSVVMQRGIIGEGGFGPAGVVGAGVQEHRAEKMKESNLPLLQIWEEGERRKAEEQTREKERLQEQKKLQRLRKDQWYLPREFQPVEGDNFSVLRALHQESEATKASLKPRQTPDGDPIKPSAPEEHYASRNVGSLGQHMLPVDESLRPSAPPQPSTDDLCSLPSYEEAINIS